MLNGEWIFFFSCYETWFAISLYLPFLPLTSFLSFHSHEVYFILLVILMSEDVSTKPSLPFPSHSHSHPSSLPSHIQSHTHIYTILRSSPFHHYPSPRTKPPQYLKTQEIRNPPVTSPSNIILPKSHVFLPIFSIPSMQRIRESGKPRISCVY